MREIAQGCLSMGRYRPGELFTWLVDLLLEGFGVPGPVTPPRDVVGWLREMERGYAEAVSRNRFGDVLGAVYQEISSNGHRDALGQFFSPESLAQLIGGVLLGRPNADAPSLPKERRQGDLVRVHEPACGSGALLLGFMGSAVDANGGKSLERFSFTAIDLDRLCARMCAAQILVNLHVHDLSVGEVLVYQGDALGPPDRLSVVFHGTIRSLAPNLVLPALHPSRLHALREAALT